MKKKYKIFVLFKDWSFCLGVDIVYWDCGAAGAVTPSGQGPFGKYQNNFLVITTFGLKILFSTKWVAEILVYFKVKAITFFKIEQR